jgi:putative restriction endonuclease
MRQKSIRRLWTRGELLILLNVYEKIPFGQFDQRQPVIKDIARRLERAPGSIAMKLCNLASLDPAIRARGRKGLPGASQLDREVWEEFHADHDVLAPESEERFRQLFEASEDDEVEVMKGVGVCVRRDVTAPNGPTEALVQRTARRGQEFFRQMILNSFDGRCAVTGIGIRELLVASHILPWKGFPNSRLDPLNGLCLSRLHDGAFDRGLITFDEDYRLVLGRELKSCLPQKTIEDNFTNFEGQRLLLPEKCVAPKQEFLAFHRKEIFEKKDPG